MNVRSSALRRVLLGAAATGAIVVGTATPAAAQIVPPAEGPCVQSVTVVNNAGFVMSFALATREGATTARTENYPINENRTIDLTNTALPEGTEVRPAVSAVAGSDEVGNTWVSFCANGQTATYTTTGTTMDYQVTLVR